MKRLISLVALVSLVSCGGSPSAPGGVTPGTAGISLTGNLSFGSVLVGATGTSTLTITNPGTVPLTVTGLTSPSGFTANWTSGTIAPGASQLVTIGFAPATAGNYSGSITIAGNQSSGTNTMSASGTAFSNMNGAWSGTQVATSASGSSTCNMSWIVTGQTGSQFAGTWQDSVGCAEAGTLKGNISSSDEITGLTLEAVVSQPNCTRVEGDGVFAGVLSGGNATVQMTDTIRCLGMVDLVRSITLSMKKQ